MSYQNIGSIRSFVSSQSTRVTDGRIDKQTDRQTDRQNFDPKDRASIAASRSKNRHACTDVHLLYTNARNVRIQRIIKSQMSTN